ncbi:Receptor-type guanylate cyclase gcy [Seminavis robusta]|uniref:Receptor-type guanylate cyclase gcy n=1 Tax=Seminavis robusta TaxID=568900 RepID=A0A9N8EKG5_9STRA|nr:Receptor-type guanylate cyclase gcy [Seminavis robusta]|eukprot:Sro1225_g254130.1 Receptor-type guanylate cyclase gcy (789) ;mRNA; r:26764-29935
MTPKPDGNGNQDGVRGSTLERVKEFARSESDGDDASSAFLEEGASVDKAEVAARDQSLAKRETKAISYLRLLVFFTIAAVATTVCVIMYQFASDSEEDRFESAFADHSTKVVDSFKTNAARRVKAIDTLSQAYTSHAISTGAEWPLVTLPDYERRASRIMDLAEVVAIFMFPIITNQTRGAWEEYALENQGWLEAGLLIRQEEILERIDDGAGALQEEEADLAFLGSYLSDSSAGDTGNSSGPSIPAEIYQPLGAEVGPEDGPGPYFPVWQWAPALPLWDLVNFNAIKGPSHTNELIAIMDTKSVVTSRAFDFSDESDPDVFGRKPLLQLILNRWKGGGNDYEDGPVSDLYYPIYSSFDASERELVAVFDTLVYWQVYFVNVLPPNADGVIVVLENTCNQSYSYQIDGPEATYLGPGDLHDPKFTEYEVSTGFGAFLGTKHANLLADSHHCTYNVKVYPSQHMKDQYTTNTPVVFVIILVCVFAFTSFVFVVYDRVVERRQHVVLETAVKSTEVVDQLFPAEVREGLYNQAKADHAPKERRPGDISKMFEMVDTDGVMEEDDDTVPNAHHYNETTVFFADIAGFTKWSSGKSAAEVFKLLEMLYGSFDRIAARRGIFKVETIGDCYMAVAGVPKPQADHAVRVAKFANECQLKMSQMRARLVARLGPDTGDLSIRIGIHSGSLTGGVLRGAKARFQLFGDTVNHASRMESTGKPWKIQASEETAELLRLAGKDDWVRPREELVEAKGKGTLMTYWVEIRGEGTILTTRTTSTSHTDTGVEPLPSIVDV